MGVKSIREAYDIGHIVTKDGDRICIGSAMVHNLIEINSSGEITKRYTWGTNDDLARYQKQIEEDPQRFKKLFDQQDDFGPLLPVFTYSNGRVVKKFCEEYGWPRTTTEGAEMYVNSYFKTYQEAYQCLLRNTVFKYELRILKDNAIEHLSSIKKQFGFLFRYVRNYLYARSIQRIITILKYHER